ncbi:expressed unknown protein [Seminavis robusta]|uniref:Uncharacterized protein n=1 Tax=Seminavis robusta TaxID=568900 RepID=A0A9N8EIP8_9STRA|nr:expressed unknown protein [Seminavis robusta]|eukprot:Sro1295_g260260.1 n/a (193) ;mRNA; r:15752-16330
MASNTIIYFRRQKIVAAAAKKKNDDEDDKRKKSTAPAISAELQAHRYTGYILSFFIFGHVWGVRGAPYAALGLEESDKLDYTYVYLATQGFGSFFPIYLIVLGLAGLWHMVYGIRVGLATLLGRSTAGASLSKMWTVLTIMVGILLVNGVAAINGWHHYEVVVLEEHAKAHEIVDQYVPPMILFFNKDDKEN